MTPLQAMKQALEALVRCKADAEEEGFSFTGDIEIDNLRTAIEQMEKAEPVKCNPHDFCMCNHIPLYTHPQLPQRIEGCMWVVTKGGRTICQPPKNPKIPAIPEGWQLQLRESWGSGFRAGLKETYSEDSPVLAAAPKLEDKP